MIKQLVLDVKVKEGTDINELNELIKYITKEIELQGHEVLTPNELIINSDVSEYYEKKDQEQESESKIDKNWLEIHLTDILIKKEEALKDYLDEATEDIEKNSIEIPILEEEISDIEYLMKNNYSEKSIKVILGSTTSNSIYKLLSNLKMIND